MEKILTLSESFSTDTLAQTFLSVLMNYPQVPKVIDVEELKVANGLHKVIEETFKNSDGLKSEDLVALIGGTEEQLEALTKIWNSCRDKVILGTLLSRKGGVLDDEDKYMGMNWEFRMVSAGKGIQSVNQPIALLQINTKNVHLH